jgi:hypothetical protein
MSASLQQKLAARRVIVKSGLYARLRIVVIM